MPTRERRMRERARAAAAAADGRPVPFEEALVLLADDPNARTLVATWGAAVRDWERGGRREPLGDVWAFMADVGLDTVYGLGCALIEAGIIHGDDSVDPRAVEYLKRHAERAVGIRPARGAQNGQGQNGGNGPSQTGGPVN